VRNGSLPAVSPQGSRILFSSNRDGASSLYTIAPDGSHETRLTGPGDSPLLPHWSGDGKRVLLNVAAGDSSSLFAIDLATKTKSQIGTFRGRSPMLSPDGARVTYSAGPFPEARLFIADLDGTHSKQITDTGAAFIGWWSHDGRQVAYALSDSATKTMNIWIVNVDGTGRRQLTQIPADEGRAEWPAWSPDGRRIAIQVGKRTSEGSTSHIWIVDVASGQVQKLAAHEKPYLDETPSWFPDGKRIAFQSDRSGRMEVWVMNAEGTEARQVTK
jgi:Tol biopolymer transport system component